MIIYLSSYLEIESAACEVLNVSKFVRPGVVALIGKKNCEGVFDFNQQLVWLWPLSEVTFHKPVYGREKRRSLKPLKEFDPRPPGYKNSAQGRPTEFFAF